MGLGKAVLEVSQEKKPPPDHRRIVYPVYRQGIRFTYYRGV